MKIKSVEIWSKNLGNTRPYTIAFKTVGDVESVFLKLNLENGQFGLGSGNPSQQVVNESIDDTKNTVTEANLEFLIGQDIRNFNGLLDEVAKRFYKTPASRAVIDIAIHDAFTKFLDVPLAKFLGQKIEKMETSVTIGIKNVADTLEEAWEYHGMGYRSLKVKTGKGVEEDVERMVKLREEFGNQMKIRIDANQGYDADGLRRFYDETKHLDIELIEQPTPAKEIELLKGLEDPIKDVIAADESLLSPRDAFVLASPPRASGIFNIKLMKSGGVHGARQIANIAEVSGIDLMWGCNDESAVSISAALHASLCSPMTKYIDLDGSLDMAEDVVSGGFNIKDGWMSITDKPGLGVSIIE